MHPVTLQAGKTQHAAMTHALRCDGQRSALRSPMQRTAFSAPLRQANQGKAARHPLQNP